MIKLFGKTEKFAEILANGGSKKSLGVQGLQSHFFLYGGHAPPHKEKNETANPGHLNFFLTPHWPKFRQTFLSAKFSQKV